MKLARGRFPLELHSHPRQNRRIYIIIVVVVVVWELLPPLVVSQLLLSNGIDYRHNDSGRSPGRIARCGRKCANFAPESDNYRRRRGLIASFSVMTSGSRIEGSYVIDTPNVNAAIPCPCRRGILWRVARFLVNHAMPGIVSPLDQERKKSLGLAKRNPFVKKDRPLAIGRARAFSAAFGLTDTTAIAIGHGLKGLMPGR